VKRENTVGRANVEDTPELEAYYASLEGEALGALWNVANEIEPWYPQPKSVPTLWKWKRIEPFVRRAPALVAAEKAARRVVMLVNPGRKEWSAAAGLLYTGVQIMNPGEFTSAHRHQASALRFVMEGKGAYTVVDDYAHHPEEVRATLRAARAAFQRRIVTVFQPHRYTRLRDLFDDFLDSFDDTDVLYLMEVFAAGEDPIPDVSARRLYEGLRARGRLNVHYLADESEPVVRLMRETAEGDLLITMGAGDVYKLGEDLLTLLTELLQTNECA